ncbi:hypothetical protein CXR04_20195 [Streptomyces sp. CMB-StM0423]|nr:hypothetical protein CXR04_20195 [Streptomyces sp. CMB-StM0423]
MQFAAGRYGRSRNDWPATQGQVNIDDLEEIPGRPIQRIARVDDAVRGRDRLGCRLPPPGRHETAQLGHLLPEVAVVLA